MKKLVEQDKIKPVLEYLERIYIEESKSKPKSAQAHKPAASSKGKSKNNAASFVVEYDLVKVLHCNDAQNKSVEVCCSETVADIRPYILCAIIRNLDFKTPGNLKKFNCNSLESNFLEKKILFCFITNKSNSIFLILNYKINRKPFFFKC